MTPGPAITPGDVALHERLGIPRELLAAAGVRRVTDAQAREQLSSRHPGDLAGVLYPYIDPTTGHPVTCRLRRDHPEIEDGKPQGKYMSAYGDRRHLYFPQGAGALLAEAAPIVIVEAEKNALAVTAAAARTDRSVLAIGTGGCWGWRGRRGKTEDASGVRVDETGPSLDFDRLAWSDRDVVIMFDANAATNQKVQAARRALGTELERRGAIVRIADLPTDDPAVNGPDDYVGKHGDEAFWRIVGRAQSAPSAAGKTREKTPKPKQGRDLQLEDPIPWPDAVDGAGLLDAMTVIVSRYLALPAHASLAIALWILHCYSFDAWFISPYLAITSPMKRCGKTLLLIVLGTLVPRRLFASSVTPAALFRTIEKYRPSLLIDEADTFVRDNDALRGVLNSGHTKTTALVIRTVGDDHDPRAFSTWCPKALALIGKLPDTLADRSIEVPMRRRIAGERVERLRQDRIDAECAEVRRRAARWADDHLAALKDADPQVPAALHDRAADCWRPLLALADVCGGRWPARAREAASALNGTEEEADQPIAARLLGDIRSIFGARATIASADLVKALNALDSRPWRTWGEKNKDKGLTTDALARLLNVFKIRPTKIRFGDKTANGYTRAMFVDAWARYAPVEPEHRNNGNNDGPETSLSEPEPPNSCSGLENAVSPNGRRRCSTVPRPTPDQQDKQSTGGAEVPADGIF